MTNATIIALNGIHAFSAIGFQTPFSLTGSQSYLSAIIPSLSSLAIRPFRALNCKAIPSTKKVGSAISGAIHLLLSIGFGASKIVARTMKNVKKASKPPINGLATQDKTTSVNFSQLIRDASYCTSRTNPIPTIPPIIECVVDTGNPNLVAIVIQTAAAIIAAMNPYIRSLVKAALK